MTIDELCRRVRQGERTVLIDRFGSLDGLTVHVHPSTLWQLEAEFQQTVTVPVHFEMNKASVFGHPLKGDESLDLDDVKLRWEWSA